MLQNFLRNHHKHRRRCSLAAELGPLEQPRAHWKHIGDGQRLALVTGRRLPAQGARKEPHEPRSHATLGDNLMVTWEIQQQVSPLPGKLAARHTTEETGHGHARCRFFRTTPI